MGACKLKGPHCLCLAGGARGVVWVGSGWYLLTWSVLEHFAEGQGRDGCRPQWGQTLRCCHFRVSKALATEPGVDQLAMAGAQRHPESQMLPNTEQPSSHSTTLVFTLLLFRFVVSRGPIDTRCLWALLAMGPFTRAPGGLSGLLATFALEARVKNLPWSASLGCSERS